MFAITPEHDYFYFFLLKTILACKFVFLCHFLVMFLAVQDSSIGDVVSQSVSESVSDTL